MRKIVDYCKTNNVEPILVNPPVHQSLHYQLDKLHQFYEQNFSDVLFYELNKIDMKDEYFGDLVHLSAAGTNYLSELINKADMFNEKMAKAHKVIY